MSDYDPYLWLEEVTADDAMAWVRARNAEAVAELTGSARFAELRDEIRAVFDADDRIPYIRRRGDMLYNFWQDAANPRGVWRRTTLESYRQAEPDWQIILDLDELATREGENWVWDGAAVLRPEHRFALVNLSRGGADANVIREFDIETGSFVEGGFELPEAKCWMRWIDIDTVYVGTDFGPDSLTSSGYPRIVKQWRRGTPLEEAVVVFEGKPDDVSASATYDPTRGFERHFAARSIDFYRTERYLRRDDELVRIDVPDDAETDVEREWLLITPRSPWTVDGTTYPPGCLIATRFEAYLAGSRDLEVLFAPDEHTSLSYHSWTRDHLIINTLHDVQSRLEVLTPGPSGWTRAPLPGVPAGQIAGITDTDPEESNEYFLNSSGYTEPATLRRGDLSAASSPEILKQAPALFDTTGIEVRQLFATSADGTKIPYYVVGSGGPTLLSGYGGFEISLTPSYLGHVGRGWLARGGTYVVANLRGGGEYGPEWHSQAVKENRHLVYEDFVAVAKDLVAQGITTPGKLGIQGGSNGGLLMGVMLTRYPEHFGAIVCQVPLLDMQRYHELLAGASWIAEYGDPREPEEWAYIKPFSPYHNIHKGLKVPPTLFVTSTRDDRVHPAHARKMVARMLEQGHNVRYYENIEGGHGAAADNEQLAFKWALVFEFLWKTLT
ncbi:prolyl oligopeptidase family serine peptidase [Actinocrispum sp. NPDC049592]|uniref:prolyl oligopeptidase family serine peptidase n=1 Tax=Actinocrispum sp. NPDC049592 TaxID=3154835 RepID=UPI003420BDA7